VPRPTTKTDLLEQSARQYAAVIATVEAMMPEKRTAEFAFEDRDRNVRDVVGHLHEWHLMMLGWYAEGMAGGRPAIPAPGHTWRTLPALNAEIWRRCQDVDLDATLGRFRQTHGELQALIESLDDAELWEKRRFAWTGSTSLGAFLVSCTSSHYVWALKKLRRHARSV
jgi:hypothetical protein